MDLKTFEQQLISANSQKKLEELKKELFTFVYSNLERFGIIFPDEDERSDFLLQFYESILRIFNTFNPNVAGFYTYLVTKLKFNALAFRKKRCRQTVEQGLIIEEEQSKICTSMEDYENDEIQTFYASEKNATYEKDIICNETQKEFSWPSYFDMTIENRRIFLLTCKSCLFLDDDMIEKIAYRLHISSDDLFKIISTLRESCIRRMDCIKKIIARRNVYYLKCNVCKAILSNPGISDFMYQKTKKEYETSKKFLAYAKKSHKWQIKAPSNSLIGRYLNINRSTIDNNLRTTFELWNSNHSLAHKSKKLTLKAMTKKAL